MEYTIIEIARGVQGSSSPNSQSLLTFDYMYTLAGYIVDILGHYGPPCDMDDPSWQEERSLGPWLHPLLPCHWVSACSCFPHLLHHLMEVLLGETINQLR